MRPASPRFLASLRDSHLIVSTCELLFPGETVPVLVPVSEGEVTIDRLSPVRRTGSVTIPWSLDVGETLGLDLRQLCFGGYATLRRGLRYPETDPFFPEAQELMALGHLRVEAVSWNTNDDVATLELADRMAQVRDEPFLGAYVPRGGEETVLTGTITHGSPLVTGLADTSGLLVGMRIRGVGVPVNTIIQTIDSSTQVTMSNPANLDVTGRAVHGRGGAGQIQVVWTDGANNPDPWTTEDLSVGMSVDFGLNVYGEPINHPNVTAHTIASIDSPTQISLAYPPTNSVVFWSPDLPVGYTSPVFGAVGGTVELRFGGGIRIAEACVEIVRQVFGDQIAYRTLFDPPIITQDAYFSDNRADTLATLAAAAAADQYFDADGSYVFDMAPGQTLPVWTIDTGEQGVLVSAEESLDRTGTVNGVLVQGQSTADQPPLSALVTDDDPASPTYWGGPFGKVARVDNSTAVQTVEQAELAAAEILNSQLGLSRSLQLTSAPNPALEAGDVVTVVFPDDRTEQHLIDTVTVGLGPTAATSLETRSIYTPASLDRHAPLPRRRRGTYYGADAWAELAEARRAR